jgi:hypothetical protein
VDVEKVILQKEEETKETKGEEEKEKGEEKVTK